MAEHAIQQDILARLGAVPGLVVWRNNTGAIRAEGGRFVRFGVVGSADVLGVASPSGQFVALEVKAPGGRVSEAQTRWGAAIRACGGVYLVVRSVDEAVNGLRAAGVAC